MRQLGAMLGPLGYAEVRRVLLEAYEKHFCLDGKLVKLTVNLPGFCLLWFGSERAVQLCVQEMARTRKIDCAKHSKPVAVNTDDYAVEFVTMVSESTGWPCSRNVSL